MVDRGLRRVLPGAASDRLDRSDPCVALEASRVGGASPSDRARAPPRGRRGGGGGRGPHASSSGRGRVRIRSSPPVPRRDRGGWARVGGHRPASHAPRGRPPCESVGRAVAGRCHLVAVRGSARSTWGCSWSPSRRSSTTRQAGIGCTRATAGRPTRRLDPQLRRAARQPGSDSRRHGSGRRRGVVPRCDVAPRGRHPRPAAHPCRRPTLAGRAHRAAASAQDEPRDAGAGSVERRADAGGRRTSACWRIPTGASAPANRTRALTRPRRPAAVGPARRARHRPARRGQREAPRDQSFGGVPLVGATARGAHPAPLRP